MVCGDRNWGDKELIRTILLSLDIDLLIEGEARGADILSREVAESLGIPFKKFPAKWLLYGKGAGMIRNRQMLDQKPDLVLAFHDNISQSIGTKDAITEAKRRSIPVRIVTHTPTPTPIRRF